jgi:hypothetical protein
MKWMKWTVQLGLWVPIMIMALYANAELLNVRVLTIIATSMAVFAARIIASGQGTHSRL